jgi:hypothetical protein
VRCPPGRWLRVHDREALAPALVPAPSPLFAFAAVRGNERAKSSRDSLALFRNLWHRLEFPSYLTGTGDPMKYTLIIAALAARRSGCRRQGRKDPLRKTCEADVAARIHEWLIRFTAPAAATPPGPARHHVITCNARRLRWDLRCHEQLSRGPISQTGPRRRGQGQGGLAS